MKQDGATPPHTARVTMEWLFGTFGPRATSKSAQFEWANYSLDLNPLDLFLWGFLKDKACTQNSQTLDELKEVVTTETRMIQSEVCMRMVANFRKRVQECSDHGGQHVEQFM